MHKNRKKRTLRANMIRVLIGTAILQLAIMFGVIILSNTTGQLDASAKQSLVNTVATQGKALEGKMAKWSDISGILNRINEINAKYCEDNHTTITNALQDNVKRRQLVQRYTSTILRLLRSSGTTGSFILLDTKNAYEKDGIYFRDLSPQVYSKDDSDILVEAGPGDYMIQYGYTLDSNWQSRLIVTEDSDFYFKPYMQAQRHGNDRKAENMGYWSPTFRLRPNDIEIITYSVPLIDEEGHVYGVIGIELSIDYLQDLTNNREIIVDEAAGMVMATSTKEKNYHAQATCGVQYQRLLPTNMIFTMNQRNDALYKVSIGKDLNHLASKYDLKLYNSNTPFEEEQWSLVGIVHSAKIERSSRALILRLVITGLVSLIISIMTAILLAINTTRPINKLMLGIDEMKDEDANLPETMIREFDELGSEIVRRNRAIWESAHKIANIIKMTDLSLGVFEYNSAEEQNFCTDKILQMFEIDVNSSSWKNNYIRYQEMKEKIKEVKKKLIQEKDEKEIYHYEVSDHTVRWIRVKVVGTSENYLCIVLDVTDEMNEKQKIKHERDYDVLTDLYNRRAFAREVKTILEEKPNTTAVMSIWDLDNLKFMNDTYGHDMGDRYINLLATVFKRVQRANVIMARMSGDEFMMFIYDENPAKICEIMRDIHRAFSAEKIVITDGSELPVSASAGMALYPMDGTTYEDLSKYADFAMYEVKNKEKGAIKLFDRSHYVRDYILVQGVGELTNILQQEKVNYVFQPIVDVHTKKIFAYEALLRPDSKLLKGPDELIRLAESQSKLGQIETITWFHALDEYQKQMEKNTQLKEVKLFLNSIPGQCLKESEFEELQERYAALISNIVMEVTEIAKTDKVEEAMKYDWCRKHQVSIALDDYGSGYSNNDILISRKLDYVKIDMCIIRDIHLLTARQKLVKSIIDYCHEKNIKIIAEGVEHREELLELIRLGADYVQGFYLARPQADIINIDDEIENAFQNEIIE